MTIESLHRQCFKKRPYRTFEYASKIAARCHKERGTPLRVYYCLVCQQFHITSKPEQKRA